jgi:hypothetical protein
VDADVKAGPACCRDRRLYDRNWLYERQVGGLGSGHRGERRGSDEECSFDQLVLQRLFAVTYVIPVTAGGRLGCD